MTSTPPMEWWRSCRGSFGCPFPCPGTRCGSSTPTSSGGGTGSLLIDTGFRLPECRQALQEGLRAAGAERGPPGRLSHPHPHRPHGAGLGGGVRPGGVLYMGEGDFPFTHQAYEDAYWAGIDQRFLREGFPVEELKATRGTNPARNLGPTLRPAQLPHGGRRGGPHRGGLHPPGHRHPRPHPGAAVPVAGGGGDFVHRRPRPL